MVERTTQSLENTMPNLLRKFNYLNPKDCELTTFLFHQPTQGGALKTFHITRISTITQLDTAGKFILSLDRIRPKTQVDHFEPPIEQVENPIPSLPSYRLSVSRLNDINNSIDYYIDETFEPSAMTIHSRLMKEIIQIKKEQGKEAYDEITRILQQHQV